MKQTLFLTPETAYQTFAEGHLGFVVPDGVLLLGEPHDLGSCVLLTPMHQTVWQGHANSQEALAMMNKTEGFALIKRFGLENPYEAIDFTEFEGTFNIPPRLEDSELTKQVEEAWSKADEEVDAFLAGELGYRVHGGVLRVQTPGDLDSCVLERSGRVMWYGNACDDQVHAFIQAHEGIIALTRPKNTAPLQA